MTDSRADANLSKPQAFETKNHPGSYSPAATPEFHQQTREPGYANSAGPDGDSGGKEWATSTAADGKFTSDEDSSADSGVSAEDQKKSTGARSTAKTSGSAK